MSWQALISVQLGCIGFCIISNAGSMTTKLSCKRRTGKWTISLSTWSSSIPLWSMFECGEKKLGIYGLFRQFFSDGLPSSAQNRLFCMSYLRTLAIVLRNIALFPGPFPLSLAPFVRSIFHSSAITFFCFWVYHFLFNIPISASTFICYAHSILLTKK